MPSQEHPRAQNPRVPGGADRRGGTSNGKRGDGGRVGPTQAAGTTTRPATSWLHCISSSPSSRRKREGCSAVGTARHTSVFVSGQRSERSRSGRALLSPAGFSGLFRCRDPVHQTLLLWPPPILRPSSY
ncbi:unnamed protein product [Rangifer tarandus platyrhynchus]|uniref:Uncharacterized protein n=1 Tax=Rangifer tarandus platyrhynchus TaxID=3082113 RepID=A0AC60A593_RANTA